MRFEKGVEVYTAAGEKIGTISRIVIDAKTKEVTDLVVERGGLLDKDENEKVIPANLVDLEKGGRIMLRETNQTVEDFPTYETTHYVPVDQKGAPFDNIETSYWYPPVSFQTPTAGMVPAVPAERITKTEVSIPEGRIAISEGAQVVSAEDKHIGNVEKVITSPDGNSVTHFVIGKGFLLKEHKLAPAFWATGMEDDKIRLSVESDIFDRLPDYKPDA